MANESTNIFFSIIFSTIHFTVTMTENIDNEDVKINLKVVGQDSNELHFLVKMSTNMGKLKKSYAERVGVPVSSVRFRLDGELIDDDETPTFLSMERGDAIQANIVENSQDINTLENQTQRPRCTKCVVCGCKHCIIYYKSLKVLFLGN